jgi:hypothetical protein
MLKVDNNPIEWPPPSIVKDKAPIGDMSEEMTTFITQLKEWYLANAPPEFSQRSSPQKSQANGMGNQVRRTASRYDIATHNTRT